MKPSGFRWPKCFDRSAKGFSGREVKSCRDVLTVGYKETLGTLDVTVRFGGLQRATPEQIKVRSTAMIVGGELLWIAASDKDILTKGRTSIALYYWSYSCLLIVGWEGSRMRIG